MIRVGLYNLKTQAAADDYIAFVGTKGTLKQREERAADWRMQNPALWKSDEQVKAEATPPSEPDPQAAAKARWKYRTTTQDIRNPPVATIDSAPADSGYDHFDFEKVHPALRR